MSHATTKNHEPAHASGSTAHSTQQATRGTRAAAPRDAAADQLRLLLLLAGDWLNNDRTHAAEIAALTAAMVGAQGPPVNVDVPFVSQTGGTLSCTMGNWTGEPTSYAYAWHNDGVANGAVDATYTVQPDDSGHSLACVVTATNALGSTIAPMSNAIAIPGTAVQDQPAMRQDERRVAAPWVRVTERGDLVPTRKNYDRRAYGVVVDEPDANDAGRNRARDGHRANMAFDTTTTGWSASCACPVRNQVGLRMDEPIPGSADEGPGVVAGGKPAIVPCVVLDPFSGAGTTALVADRLGRHAIGIDLSHQYVEMSRARLEADCPLFTSWAPAEDPEESRMADLFQDMAAD
jgi:hypothetical protein